MTWSGVHHSAVPVAEHIEKHHKWLNGARLYGIPRGGILAALAVQAQLFQMGKAANVVEDVQDADFFIDDIIDSGKTAEYYSKIHKKPFLALIDKRSEQHKNTGWVSFPWERMQNEIGGAEDAVVRLIQYIGDNPLREGLQETPRRVMRAYSEMFAGYKMAEEIPGLFKQFNEQQYDEMVILRSIDFTSCCEHHMLPFIGTADVAYVPRDGKIIGISKLARLVEIFSKRLQVQERMTEEIAGTLMVGINPLGVGVVVRAKHLCMICRGVKKPAANMITSKLLGVFRDQTVRAEFFSLCGIR
jgi:GTP cyclohydrolase I